MKKTFLLFCMAVATLAANATTYALYGTAPEGATDLTANVTASALGSTTFAEGVFTGAGLPGRINETGNYLQLTATDASMSLTDTMALHLVIKRAATGAGNVQVSLCNGGWNNSRIAWEISASQIADTMSHIVLKYADRNTGNWNSYNEAGAIGENKAFSGEILRLCAANGEQIEIAAIYAESGYADPNVDPTPGPGPEPVVGNLGYAIYGSVPEDYSDYTGSVTIAGAGNATWSAPTFTGGDFPGIIANTGHYMRVDLANKTMSLTDKFALHLHIKKAAGNTGNLQVSFTNGNWNGCRTGWLVLNDSLSDTEYRDIVLLYSESDETMSYSSDHKENLLGTDVAYNGTIMRFCAAAGQQFDIDQIYIEKTHVAADGPTEIPEQDPTRIYLHKGTAETPAGVAEVDYTAGASLISEWWNCDIATDFFGVTTQTPADGDWDNGWWFNFQYRNTVDVDLTPVYATWRLVVRVKNEVAEEGQDRGLTFTIDGKKPTFVTTLAETTQFTVHEMSFEELLDGASHLKAHPAGTNVFSVESSNNHTGGRNVEFDYIYLTNEPATPTAVENVIEVRAEKVIRNGQVYILRGGNLYNVAGSMVK